jgi:hypothetical protein
MSLLQKLFKPNEFTRLKMGYRVRHMATGWTGTVVGLSILYGSIKVHAVNVKYDNGKESDQAVSNEFVIIGGK